jgi:hypothetical protein
MKKHATLFGAALLAFSVFGCSGDSEVKVDTPDPVDKPVEVSHNPQSDDPLDIDRVSLKVGDVGLWLDMTKDYATDQMGSPVAEMTLDDGVRSYSWQVGGMRVIGDFADAGALGWHVSGKGEVKENHYGDLTYHRLNEDVLETTLGDRVYDEDSYDGEGDIYYTWANSCGPEALAQMIYGTSVPFEASLDGALLEFMELKYHPSVL